MAATSCRVGAFSQRETVGCEQRSRPVSGKRPQASEAQPVKIVSVFITAGDGKDPGAQDLGKQMDDPVRIALVGDYPGELVGDTEAPLRLGEEHYTTIRRDPSAIERGAHLFARYRWRS